MQAEGSTNAQAGIELAYQVAFEAFKKDGINRIVLCSDGVANNGITDADAIFARVKHQAEQGISLSTVGFGMGSYNDVLMEKLADRGDGNYAYVDRLDEARRIFRAAAHRHAADHREGHQAAARARPRLRRALPADRLREPHAHQSGLRERQGRRRRPRRRSRRHRNL